MNVLLDLIISTSTQGLIYALLSFGVYITYKILDFPDLTVDGSFPLGAAVTAVMMTNGSNPWLTLPVSMAAGALAGLTTGLIHVKLKVRDLLAGIITMTALFSINLQIAGSNLIINRDIDTIFTSAFVTSFLGSSSLIYRKLIVSLLIVIMVKVLLDLYFMTKSGLLLRAVGDNSVLVTSLAKDKGTVKIIGLVISNALVALSGSIVCHEQRAFSSTMGTGQVVFGLATVIIGTTIFQKFDSVHGTTAALIGSIIYKACMQLAISLGLPANLLKLITAVLFLAILVFGNYQKRHNATLKQKGL
ncbi:MAG: putative tryptophan/tyrosine transport system permease protein [Clostridiales bacterium]|jgi:putative ABC transport system permease protein|nr:putative tryptophan/tyrosine transport system permease protein [Clostridiales bacterium]